LVFEDNLQCYGTRFPSIITQKSTLRRMDRRSLASEERLNLVVVDRLQHLTSNILEMNAKATPQTPVAKKTIIAQNQGTEPTPAFKRMWTLFTPDLSFLRAIDTLPYACCGATVDTKPILCAVETSPILPMRCGFLYLVRIPLVRQASRKRCPERDGLAYPGCSVWRISNTLEANFCVGSTERCDLSVRNRPTS